MGGDEEHGKNGIKKMGILENLEHVLCNLCDSNRFDIVHESQYENETSRSAK